MGMYKVCFTGIWGNECCTWVRAASEDEALKEVMAARPYGRYFTVM